MCSNKLMVLAAALAACSHGFGETIRVTLKDQVKTINLAKGDTLEVSLDRKSAASNWSAVSVPAFLREEGHVALETPAKKGDVRGQRFTFRVTGPGSDLLTMRLSNGKGPALQQFTITVSVPK